MTQLIGEARHFDAKTGGHFEAFYAIFFDKFIKYGHNRDNEKLPQLNLAILFGQKGRLPVYFQRLPGNITDVTALHGLLKTFKTLEMKTFHYVMDKGFYSKKNVDELLTSRDKFVLSVPLNNKWIQHTIDDIHEVIHGPEGYRKLDDETLYVHTRLYPWGKGNRRCYLHLFAYNADRQIMLTLKTRKPFK